MSVSALWGRWGCRDREGHPGGVCPWPGQGRALGSARGCSCPSECGINRPAALPQRPPPAVPIVTVIQGAATSGCCWHPAACVRALIACPSHTGSRHHDGIHEAVEDRPGVWHEVRECVGLGAAARWWWHACRSNPAAGGGGGLTPGCALAAGGRDFSLSLILVCNAPAPALQVGFCASPAGCRQPHGQG